MRKSNCFLKAWKQYQTDPTIWLCFKRSKFSKLENRIPKIVKVIALILLWPIFGLYVILHVIAFESWPHFVWRRDMPEGAEEFVPLTKKYRHWLPPMFFNGITRKYFEQPNSRP